MKKTLAVLLSALMVLGACLIPVAAEETSTVTLPEAFYVYSGETGAVEMTDVPAMSGWTVCQTITIGATTGQVGIAQTSPDGEWWDTGVIYDIESGTISSQLGTDVSVSTSPVYVSGQTFFAVTFDGTTQLVYINGTLVATITGFDHELAAEYLAPAYICGTGCFDQNSGSFVTDENVTTGAMSMFAVVFTAEQVALAYSESDIELSNYAAVTSAANVWYEIDCTASETAKTMVIDLATLEANIALPATGYTKVTTFHIPEGTYEKGSLIGIAQIRESSSRSYYASVAYDLGTGIVSLPYEKRSGFTWWDIDESNAVLATGDVQFIEIMDHDGNLAVYVNGQLALKAHPHDIVETDDNGVESHDSIMRFLLADDFSVLLLGDYNDAVGNYDVNYSLQDNGAYSSWNASYVVNNFTKYGVTTLSAKGYKLAATTGAIADFYKNVDTLNTESNLSSLGSWYTENFFDLSDVDNAIVGLTKATAYTYDNTGIDLSGGYTKVAVFYLPDNSDGSIEENCGWIDVFADTATVTPADSEPVDGIRYDIGSGLVRSECTTNYFRWGQTSFPVKTSGFTVFTMTCDGHAIRVWVNGQLAYYAHDNEAVPANSYGYTFAKTTGLNKGDQGLLLDNHTTATKNSYGIAGTNIYDEYGAMLSYEAGYTGVATDAAVAELTLEAAKIAATLSGTHIHTWSEWTITSEPTCTETGMEARTCSECGKTESRVVAAKGHTWGDWTIVSLPTATENGSKTRTCSVCGEVQTVEIEPLVSCVTFDGLFGKTPYFSYDYTAEGGLTDVVAVSKVEKAVAFTNEVKITTVKIPNRVYAEGSTIGIALAHDGGVGSYDMGFVYDLGTGLVSSVGMYTNVISQTAVKATGVVEFIEVITGTEIYVYVNGVEALHIGYDGEENYITHFTSGRFCHLMLNLAGDKTSNAYALYGVKTLYGAAYNDVEVSDALLNRVYMSSIPETDQIISTTLPAYKNVTGKSATRTTTNYLSAGGSDLLIKDLSATAITSQLVKVTALYIPDVEYTNEEYPDGMTVGISLLSDGDAASFDWSVKYNLATGEVSPAKTSNVFLTEAVVSNPVKAVGYVQFIEIFDGTRLEVFVNGQLAFSAGISAENIATYGDYFVSGAYKHLFINATGDGQGDASTVCNGVKTMYLSCFHNPSADMTETEATAMYDLFLNSITRAEQPEPEEPSCTHTNTEIRGAVDATCSKEGYTGDTYCTDCGEKIATGKTIEKLAHTTEIRNAVDATCTSEGYTGDTYCTVCGELIASGTVIPMIDHNFVDGVCTECGEKQVLNGFVTLDGNLYYYENGTVKTGWFVVDGKTYYGSYTTGVCVNTDKILGNKQYFWNDETGLTLADGFYEVEGGTVCYDEGLQVIGWRHTDGSGPVIGEDGISEQYSTSPNNLYYFLSSTGFMVTDSTYKLGGLLREFNDDHTVKPVNGFQLRYGIMYAYDNGTLLTGWKTDEATGNTYYFQASDAVYGQAATKWMYIGDKLYYFYASTSNPPYALKKSGSIGGISYTYAEDGQILYTGFINTVYANANNSNAAAYIQKMNGTTRYLVNGEIQYGWQQIGGKWYYFYAKGSSNGSGYMCTASRYIGGVWYEFTEDGVCTSK